MAETLARIHGANIGCANGALLRPHRSSIWTRPTVMPRGRLALQLAGAVEATLPGVDRGDEVLLHDDYHPGNILWDQGRLSGVVDWSAARVGPALFDVAACRTELALLFGLRAADRFAATYLAATGRDGSTLPVWDLVPALSAVKWHRAWLDGFAEHGHVVEPTAARRRLTRFAERALARL